MSVDPRSHFNVPYNHVMVVWDIEMAPGVHWHGCMGHWNGTWSPLKWLYGTLKWDLESTDIVVWDIPFQCSIQPCQWTPGPISMSHTTMSVDSRSHFNDWNGTWGSLTRLYGTLKWDLESIGIVVWDIEMGPRVHWHGCMGHWNGTWSPLTWLYGTLKWDLGSTDIVVWGIGPIQTCQ
jgi:hypothetical protein